MRAMDRSFLARAIAVIAGAVFLGFVAARQQQIMNNQREILEELQEMKASRPAETPSASGNSQPVQEFDLSIEGAAVQGNANAALTLIEFSDFECPFCGRYVKESFPRIQRDYVDTGKIRYVFRHFPIARLHPKAVKASEAGECARTQGKFWPLHDRLFANQKALDRQALVGHAQAIGLDLKTFETCLDGQATSTVLADLETGGRAGVSATPTFFLGFPQKNGSIRVVEKIAGAKPYTEFQTVLDRMLTSPADSKN
jgi:protein-disulfide isomerase